MKRINLLTEETANKIAAGEVVERPYSVVKELIENSIDAASKNITIQITEGGQKCITVLDDGVGIHPDDIKKAFLAHATSKINEIEDIYKITTMGFRGEALASIGAVSNTILRSRTKEFPSGREISISGGVINYIKDCAMNVGTYIEIRDLFYNVPARLKFMKSSPREAAAISDIVNRIALANCSISFQLYSNDKKMFHSFGNGNLIDCIRSVYGKNISENIVKIENYTDLASVYGYVGNSEISRGSRNNQSIFVNLRYIKSKLITAAVENACKSFLMTNKFPFFLVYIDIFPELIDVNIHPTKSEIKFKEDRMIFKIVFDAVHTALKESLKDSFTIIADSKESESVHENLDYFGTIDSKTITSLNNPFIDIPIDLRPETKIEYVDLNTEKSKAKLDIKVNTDVNYHDYEKTQPQSNLSVQREVSTSPLVAKFPELTVIGQFDKTYILAQAMSELYIIDQHAAHEKLLFEKFKRDIEKSQITVQLLLCPIVLQLTTEEYINYIENQEIFKTTGFTIELFGDNTITVREVPYILGKINIKNCIIELLDNLKNLGSGKTSEVKYNSIAKMACKSAVKANNALSQAEITALIEGLRFCEEPYNCPHGRPTIIKITLNELEKRFKRIQ